MAKEDKATFEITVIQVKTTSSNETLRQNVREIANTISRSINPQIRGQQQLPSGQSSPQMPLWNEDQEVNSSDNGYVNGEVITENSKPKSKAERRVRTPQILTEIEFTSGDVPFKDYYELKGKPDANNKRYLLIISWFKEHRGNDEITVGHVYTCYRFMGWSAPKDPGQPFRNIKHHGWISSGNKGHFRITHIGINVINEMAAE